MDLPPTPSQTVGPFFGFALPREGWAEPADPADPAAVTIQGRVLDGDGTPVTDALIEIFQAGPGGEHPGPGAAFRGFGRCRTDAGGGYRFVTLKPGPTQAPGGRREAPHLEVLVFARGLLRQLATRLYFPDEAEANAADPYLAGLHPDSASTLVGVAEPDHVRFDIRLQGPGETAFFDL